MSWFWENPTQSDLFIDVLLMGDIWPNAAPTFLSNGKPFLFSFNLFNAWS